MNSLSCTTATPSRRQTAGWALGTAIFAGFLLFAPAGFAQGTGLEELEKQVKEFTTENGIKFIVVERHDTPVFSFQTLVNAGSANEQIGETGIAHMMEHMAFKGTEIVGVTNAKKEREALEEVEIAYQALLAERRKGAKADSLALKELKTALGEAQETSRGFVVSNEFSRIMEENGAQGFNAFTGDDYTGYLYSLPSNRLELWAVMEGSRMAFPVFREFYKEREVVYEERRMRYESSPIGRMILEFLHGAYVAHPYGSGGIGHPSDLKTFSRKMGDEFYRKYYIGPNMAVAVVGDVSTGDVEKYAKKYFSDIPDGPPSPVLDVVEPEQNAERRLLLEDPSQPAIIVGWHIPSLTHPDYSAYEALASLLAGGDFARLPKTLVKEKKIAVQVQAFVGLPGSKYPTLFALLVIPAPGEDPFAVEKEVYAALDEIMEGDGFTSEELDGYKVRTRAQMIEAAEDNDSLAGQLVTNQTLFGDWREFFRSQERVRSLTLDDLTRVMKKSLVRTNRTVAVTFNPVAEDMSEGGTE